MEERLQKVMAHAGVASRRTCEEMIQQGRVRVNGKVVSELGTKVDPARDIVLVDGSPITGPEAPRYIVLYKPRGHLSAMEPEGGRPCLADLVQVPQRLYPVGRLDLESEGLMLLTNDGELAHRLTHPRYQHPKEYLVLIEGRPGTIALRKLRQGVDVADRLTAPAEVTIVDGPPAFLARPDDARPIPTTWLHMVLREGRKREIRHMTAAVGHPALRLIRIGLGPLRLEHMKPGSWRDVNARELRALRRLLRPAAGPVSRDAQGRRDAPARPSGIRPPRAPGRGPRTGRPADQGARPPAGKPPARSARPAADDRTRPPSARPDDRTRPASDQSPRGQGTPRRPASGTRPASDQAPRDPSAPRRPPSGKRPGSTGRPPRGSPAAASQADRPPARGDRSRAADDQPAGRTTRPADRRGRPPGTANRRPGASPGGRAQRRPGKKRPPA